MAEGWREVAIGEIADVVGGSTPSTKEPDNFDGGIPWLTPKDLSGPHDRYIGRGERDLSRKGLGSCSAKLLPTDSVLLSTRAPIGYVALAKNPIATNQGFRSLVVRDGFSPEYLYYWLVHNTEELERHASGSTFKELSGSALKSIRLRIPPLDEQRAIAHVLGTLDDKIELNRRMNETLEAMVRALFRSWFVDFEPVRAKIEGRWRPGESLPGLPARLHHLFPDRLIPSELGDIPEGWEASTIGQHLTTLLGGTPARSEPRYWGGAIPWINSGAVNASRILGPSEFITEEGLAESAAKMLPVRTTVIAITGATLGQVSLTEIETAANQSVVGVLSSRAIPGEYVYGWVEERIEELVALQTGGAQQHVNKGNVNELLLMVPAPDVLHAYIRLVRPVFDEIALNHWESSTLAAQRDGLMPRMVSGELHVGSMANLPEVRD